MTSSGLKSVQEATASMVGLSNAILDEGKLIPPVDSITAHGISTYGNDEPHYHDLSCMPYTKFDVQEWTGKIQKFKAETVRYATQCRRLQEEVSQLQDELAHRKDDCELMDTRIQKASAATTDTIQQLQEETARRNACLAESLHLRQSREQLIKQIGDIRNGISQARNRIGLLRTEVERNHARHIAALGEKERLNLERRWFYRERLLLEKTTEQEVVDVALMKEKLERLRHCMHQAWKDTKEMDLLGHLRATKRSSINEEWFAARRRIHRVNTPKHTKTKKAELLRAFLSVEDRFLQLCNLQSGENDHLCSLSAISTYRRSMLFNI